MGKYKLNTLMKTMALKANNNECLTNQSARKHMIQKLNDNDIASTHNHKVKRAQKRAKHCKLQWLETKPAKKYIR